MLNIHLCQKGFGCGWALASLMILSLACGGGGSSSAQPGTPNSSPPASPTPPPSSGPLSLQYSFAPFPINTAISTVKPSLGNAGASLVSYAVGSGSLPDGITLNADGSLTGTPTVAGSFPCQITAIQDGMKASADLLAIVLPPAVPGVSADYPRFVLESIYGHPHGPPGGAWPEQLFWQDVTWIQNQHNEDVLSADGIESSGRAPLLGEVAWGIDLTVANGGDAASGLADYSQKDGYKQYAAWMNPRKNDYFALKNDGTIAYPGEGYISFGMPMLPADAEFPGQTFGQWTGKRTGNLALYAHCRGIFAADYFIGLNFYTDYHPRLIDAFEVWSGEKVPGATVADRARELTNNHAAKWLDFLCDRQALYLATMGQTILAAGKTPMIGGGFTYDPATARLVCAQDLRMWTKYLPAKYWIIMLETESAGDRDPIACWLPGLSIGASAAREPDVAIGAWLDADIGDFWGSAARVGWTKEQGWRFLKHIWLSAGWTHIAGRDGAVRRAAQGFQRSFWDAGDTNPDHINTILGHIPRHPFGPAMYYSVNVEKTFLSPYHYPFIDYLPTGLGYNPFIPKGDPRLGALWGLSIGYWMSDAVDLSKLQAADKPSAWVLYKADLLPTDERARLTAIAPVYDLETQSAQAIAACPVRSAGSGLNNIAFVDQNGSVIVMITNQNFTDTNGTLDFSQVSDGTFACRGLLGTPSASLTINNHVGSIPITVGARDTLVFEIPKLKWVGH